MNKSTKSKLLVASAIAATSVASLAPGAIQAELTEVEQLAADLAQRYVALDADRQTVADIVLANVSENLGLFIETDFEDRTALIPDLKALIAPPNASTEAAIKAELQTRVQAFIAETQPYLEDDGELQDLILFAQRVSLDVYTDLQSADLKDLNSLYIAAFDSFETNATANIQDVVKQPTPEQAINIIAEIEKEVDAALSPPDTGGGTPDTPETPDPIVVGDDSVAVGGDYLQSNPQAVIDAIEDADEITEFVIEAADTAVALPVTVVSALLAKNEDVDVYVATPDGSLKLPLGQFDLAAIAAELGVTSAELNLVVNISTQEVTTSAEALSPVTEFEIYFQAPNGDALEVAFYGSPFEGYLSADEGVTLDPYTTLGIKLNGNGSYTPLPTFVNPETLDEVMVYFSESAAIQLIEYFATFEDVNGGVSRFEEAIERLASRQIVYGKTEELYAPNKSITRGEFTAILARGLGLRADSTEETGFSDVSASQAVNRNGEIAAAVNAGIVSGYPDGTFRPNEVISRGDAAILISKAIDYIAQETEYDESKDITDFTDYSRIGAAARPHVERVLEAGYLNGYTNGTYRAQADTTRGQMAYILYNFLEDIEHIN